MSDATRSKAARQTRRDDLASLLADYVVMLRVRPRTTHQGGADPGTVSILAAAVRAARRISPALAREVELQHVRLHGPETPPSTI